VGRGNLFSSLSLLEKKIKKPLSPLRERDGVRGK